jgi:hypothetical protein
MAEREGFEDLLGVENTEVIGSIVRTVRTFLSLEGFLVQNRVQAVCSPCLLLSKDSFCARDNGNDLLRIIWIG